LKLLQQGVFVFLFFLIIACKSQQRHTEIVIKGYVIDLPNGQVYLTDAYKRCVPFDSTESVSGHFVVILKPDSTITPFLASISFPDTTYPAGMQLLFRNHMRKDILHHARSAFYLGRGYTRIEGTLAKQQLLSVYGREETDRYSKITMP
jgi:hypothetical protein